MSMPDKPAPTIRGPFRHPWVLMPFYTVVVYGAIALAWAVIVAFLNGTWTMKPNHVYQHHFTGPSQHFWLILVVSLVLAALGTMGAQMEES